MPASLAFWQLPSEEETLLSHMESFGPILAYPAHWVEDQRELTPQPIHLFIQTVRPAQCCLALERSSGLTVVQQQEKDGKTYYGVTSMQSCVVTYRRGEFRDGVIALSHLSAYWDRLDHSRSIVVPKDNDFVAWGKKIFSIVRKLTPHSYKFKDYRATDGVADAVARGIVELVDY